MKIKKTAVSLVLALISILNVFPSLNFLSPAMTVFAADAYDPHYMMVYGGDTIGTDVINYDGHSIGPGAYIIVEGVQYPAFCVDTALLGADKHQDGMYPVNMSGTNMSATVSTVLHNSVPYTSKADILTRFPGLTDLQIYAATKAAIRAVAEQSESQFPNDDLWNGDPQTVAFAKYLITLAKSNPGDIPKSAIYGTVGSARLDNDDFFILSTKAQATNYSLFGDTKIKFTIPSTAPAGTVITFEDGTPIPASGVDNATQIHIKVPKSSVPEGTSGSFDVKVDMNINSYVALFGIPVNASDIDKYQRYEISLPNQPVSFTIPMSYFSEPKEEDDEPALGGLQIVKYDNVTAKLAAGAIFEVKGLDASNKTILFQVQASAGAVVPSVENGAVVKVGNGTVSVDGIPVGKYQITELTPPPNYDISPDGLTSQIVEVQDSEIATVYPQVMFRNNPFGKLKITKIDAVTGQSVAGATLRIRNEVAGIDITRTTDSSGVINLIDLPQGNYSVTEVNAGANYELSPRTVVVPVRWGQLAEAVFDNEPHTSLEVMKINSKTNQPVAGAVFTLKQLATGKEWTLTTLASGKAVVSNIPAGNYTVKEIFVPEPLILNSKVVNIQIDNDKVNSYTAVNDENPKVTIEKYDEKTGKLLGGAEFRLERLDGAWQTEFMLTTGTRTFTLAPGTYRLTEIAAPWGYLIATEHKDFVVGPNDEITIKFDNRERPCLEILKIDEETGKPLAGAKFRVWTTEGETQNEYVTDASGRIFIENLNDIIYSVEEIVAPDGYLLDVQHKDVKLEWGITKTLIFTNKARSALEILKIDEETGKPLAGAKFYVTETESGTVSEYITDATGRIIITGLKDVIYSVEEIVAPKGYLLEAQHKDIKLEWGKTKTLIFTNKARPKLEIKKIDTITGLPLAGARFKVTKTEDLTVSEYVTNAAGIILIENLDDAIYTIEEIVAPDGYILNPQHKEIQLEWGKTKTLIYENTRKPTLIITKTNALTFMPVPNTTYKIEYEDSNGGIHNLGTKRTDENGQIILTNVNPGWYIITETIAAPGFSLSSNPVTRKYLALGENAYTNYSGTGAVGLTGDISGTNIEVFSGSDFYALGQEIFNYPLNSLVIRKAHFVTGEMLAGAAFEVYKVTEEISGTSGTLIGRYTTDNSGVIVLTGLEPGGYIVKEVQAPPNFLISENSQQQAWLKYDGTSIVEVTFANIPYGALLITKVDTITKKPLANARFKVTDSSGAVVGNTNGEYVTNASGEIIIPNVKPGSYVVTEIEAPANYDIDTTPQTITVGVDGKTYSVSFKNQPAGTLVIRKLDFASKEPLANAEFKVTTSGGNAVGTGNGVFKTDAMGIIAIPNLPKGSYVIEEIKAPNGYILENQSKTIEMENGKSYTLDFYNKKMSSMQIIKIDSVTKQPLKGVEFTVYKQSGETVGRYTTDANGVIIIDTLAPGWYKAVETKTLDGYLIDDIPKDFQITDNQFVQLVFENAPMSNLIIRKVDSDTREPLEGAEFTVKTMAGELIGVYRSDEDGLVNVPTLEPGWYTVTETIAPVGYSLGDNTQTVEITNSKTVTIEFRNRAFGSLQIKKIDEISGKPLVGAQFTVSHQAGAFVGEYTTGVDGTISIPNMAPGWYVVSETKAPQGYQLDSTAKTVEVKSVVPTVTTFTNKPHTAIEIIKTDSVTHNPLANATFKVERPNGELIGTYKTDASGKALVSALTEGTYIVSETIPPSGYMLNETPKTVAVVSGKVTIVEFVNNPFSGIQIIKTDAVTKQPLADATFEVKNVKGEKIGTYKTDVSGKILVSNLPEGVYIVSETAAPVGYMLHETPQTVNVVSGKLTTVEFTNKPYSGIQIIKTDALTDAPLAGAVFTVQRSNGELVGDNNGKYTTDVAGKIIVPDLPEGTYIITEVKAPTEYILDALPKTVEVKTGKLTVAEFTNTPFPYLHIVKIDAASGKMISGAEFIVTNSNGEIIANVISQASGPVSIKVAPGVYTVTEVRAPEGYENNDPVQTVTVLANGSTVFHSAGGAVPGNTTIFANRPLNSLEIVKLDAVTHNPLSSARFDVEKANGERIGTFRTDASGSILLTGLTEGTYIVKEISAPTGYILNESPKSVNLSGGKLMGIEFLNKPLSGIQIIKLDSITRNPLQGAAFTVSKANGECIGTFTTEADGKVLVPGLDEGVYVVGEISAPDGYVIDEAPKNVTVKSGALATVEFVNKPLSGIEIIKTDSVTNNPLAGATFTVEHANGSKVGTYKTDSSGKAIVSGLAEGTYIVSETIAPSGYMLNDTPKNAIVTSGKLTTVEFTNKPNSGIQIIKLDAITNRSLTGATFTVERDNGEKIGTYKTDAAGKIIVPDLVEGTYIVSETIAPSGYVRDDVPKTVIVKTGKLTTIEFTNRPHSGIEIIKMDAVTKAPLMGATFVVERPNGEKVGTYKTDAAGKIIVPDLAEGTYIVSETIAPSGYVLNETPKTVEVKSGKLTSVEFTNNPLSGIQIIKLDAETKAPLTGATFVVERTNGEKLGTYKTDSTGKIIVPGLADGTYIISETIAPSGYILDEAPKTVDVKSGKLTIVEFFNKPLSGLRIVKLDSVTRNPIEGVEFQIAKMNGEKVENDFRGFNFKTDRTGQIYIPRLDDGYYVVTETRSADGYALDGEPKTVLVQSGKTTVLEVLNTPMSGLLIVKTDSVTGKPISGAVFDIKRADGSFVTGNILDGNQPNTANNSPNKSTSPNGDIPGSYTTDANGRILLNGLAAGQYTVTERKAPSGYELDTEVYNVTVLPGKLAQLQLTNTPKAGLRLVKTDSITKKPIFGVEFMLFDSGNKVVGVYITDNNGIIDFPTDIPEGRYTIRETRAAAGYYIDDMPKTVEFRAGRVTEINWENTPHVGQFQITKKSADDNPINGFPKGTLLEGAVFEIYDRANNLVDTITTNKNGLASSKNLPVGRYTLREVKAPAYYMASAESIDIEIEHASQIVRLEVYNKSVYTNVSIQKRGYTEVIPGQQIRYDFKNIANNSSVALDSFYWRDTLPTDAVRLNKIVTGTWSQKLSYKIVFKTNINKEYRTLADNLSTDKSRVIDASPAALGLAANEFVTEFMVVFGRVPAGFKQVEAPYITCDVLKTLPHEYRFSNKCDVGGLWGSQWIQANDRWVTVVYNKTTPSKLPRTGY